jgi:predicted NAD/FAD-binding protein
MTRSIAVIGSGMAGLAAAWFLSQRAQVTLLERHDCLGMGAHSVVLPGGTVDVPLRVIYPGYYPQLFELLSQVGVGLQPLDASLSFCGPEGASHFRYRNLMLAGKSLPWVAPAALLRRRPRRILLDLGRFLLLAPRALARGELRGQSLGQYLDTHGFSREFADDFLVPCFAGIATADCEDVRRYPVEVIAAYFSRAFMLSSVYRAEGGAAAIGRALAAPVAQTRLGVRLRGVARAPQGVTLTFDDGESQPFDAVVFATQANQVLPLLADASAAERQVLGAVRYGKVRVVMHRDARLAPRRRADWAPVNYLLSHGHDRPMATIWVNRLLRASYRDPQPLFQTLDPTREPDPATVLQDTALQRPLVDLQTAETLRQLDGLHREPDRRVFFCGSFAAPGIPLLESAVASAKKLLDAPGLLPQ